ncbi:unnamed protein product, partial [Rotaria magnacalcarata]
QQLQQLPQLHRQRLRQVPRLRVPQQVLQVLRQQVHQRQQHQLLLHQPRVPLRQQRLPQ